MAINLNLAKYGDQFKAFENFARENANNMDALARIGGDGLEGALLAPDGKPRAIVAKTDDDKIKRFKQNLFFSRNADQKALNTAVRYPFPGKRQMRYSALFCPAADWRTRSIPDWCSSSG